MGTLIQLSGSHGLGAGRKDAQLTAVVQEVGHPLIAGTDRCDQDHLGQVEANWLQVPRIGGVRHGRHSRCARRHATPGAETAT